MKKMPKHQTLGLPHKLQLKIGIRYMITSNIDLEDGLVNGATGILRFIDFQNPSETDPKKKIPKTLYIEFASNQVGQKARRVTQTFL